MRDRRAGQAALDAHPELSLLQVAVPLHIADLAGLDADARFAIARQASEHIQAHGDLLMFRGKPGASAEAFNQLARGLAAAAYQPGGVTFAGLHFCTDHAVCKAAEAAAGDHLVRSRAVPLPAAREARHG